MSEPQDIPNHDASGLSVLALILRFHGIAVDPGQLRHQYGNHIGVTEILRCAKDLKLKARAIESNWERIAKTPMPAIAELRDGSFIFLSKAGAEAVLILDPTVGRPQSVPREEFESQWSGRLILMARRAALSELSRRFDIGWFLQAM